jgi:methylated-DNA-[protein]-cysteine S-methyltransferase
MTHHVKKIATPLGELVLAASDRGIAALVFKKSGLARLGITRFETAATPLLEAAERQLKEYFAGRRKAFDLPFDLAGTDFQKSVWKQLQKIPYGKTASYSEVAEGVGSPKAVRAVGSANGKNPVCILIPCHRVVRLSGEIGGYAGGIGNKAYLLELEQAS